MSATMLLLLVIGALVEFCWALNVTRVVAPPWLAVGGSGDLECQFSLGSETLYSIKWYQGINEIYRYTPGKVRTQQVFHNNFLSVDVNKSSGGKVHVTNVTVGADGAFRCEVSGEAPRFYTDYGVANVRIIALPASGPELRGVQELYVPDDWVQLTCIASETRPAPVLTFSINGKEPRAGWLEPPSTSAGADGLFTTTLRLRFYLREHLIQDAADGAVRVRCTSHVPGLYHESTDVLLHTRAQQARASGHEGRVAAGGRLLTSYFLNFQLVFAALLTNVAQQYHHR
ncbi:uncharacterized protein LOC108676436 [Hyalella azteca]|uniref:Uncharacterized protein LOC108676436 n=1 Tax=Hyalella azteca TaxID=294128 RepID=A0A979FLK2_HYAAZ|nr:uncharacterized protein LOC108676436 [Hyalella azteca]